MAKRTYFNYNGILLPTLGYSEESLRYTENEFQLLDDDMVTVSYPKSVIYGSWFDHVKGWLKLKDRPNVFFITYEELQQDLRGSVERISHFLGKELDSRQLDAVVKNASFQIMKDNKMSNFSHVSEDYMDHKKGKFMRKGISGDWKNHLTVAQSECFDRVYQERMQGLGVNFPWE